MHETVCPHCQTIRFTVDDESVSIDKKMANFFLCADLKEIQQFFYTGITTYIIKIIDPTCYKSMKQTLSRRQGSKTVIGDIYTGKVYSQHVQQNRLGKIWQTSYSLCTDGVR